MTSWRPSGFSYKGSHLVSLSVKFILFIFSPRHCRGLIIWDCLSFRLSVHLSTNLNGLSINFGFILCSVYTHVVFCYFGGLYGAQNSRTCHTSPEIHAKVGFMWEIVWMGTFGAITSPISLFPCPRQRQAWQTGIPVVLSNSGIHVGTHIITCNNNNMSFKSWSKTSYL